MALELATAIVRVKFDKSDLAKEIAAARKQIQKGLSGIRVKVKVDLDIGGAAAAGKKAGRQASQSASTAFTMQSRRIGFGGPAVMGLPNYTNAGLSRTMGAKPPPFRGGAFIHPHRLANQSGRPNYRSAPGPQIFDVPPGSYSTRPGGGGGRGTPPPFVSPSTGGGGRGRGGRGGAGGAGPRTRATGNMPRFSGMQAFALGAGFQVAPNMTTAAAFGGAPGLAGAAVGAGVAAGTRAYMDFEKPMEMVKILQRQSGATEQDLAKLEARARSLGRTTLYSATENAKAMQVLTQDGMKATDIFKVMPHVLDMAAADGAIPLEDAAKLTASALVNFGKDAGSARDVVDTLTTAANESRTSVEGIGTALAYVGSLAKDANLSMEETSAMIATLSQAGILNSRIGTSSRQLIRDFTKDSTREAFANNFGVNVRGMNPLQAAQAVSQSSQYQNMAPQDRLDVFSRSLDANASTAFAALVNNVDFTANIMRRMGEDTGKAAATAQEKMELLSSKITVLTGALLDLGISITTLLEQGIKGLTEGASGLAAILSDATQTLSDFRNWISQGIDKNPWLTEGLSIGGVKIIGIESTGKPLRPDAIADNTTGSSGPIVPSGSPVDTPTGEFPSVAEAGTRGGRLIDTRSIWSTIQAGLKGDTKLTQIEKNTAQIVENTDPKHKLKDDAQQKTADRVKTAAVQQQMEQQDAKRLRAMTSVSGRISPMAVAPWNPITTLAGQRGALPTTPSMPPAKPPVVPVNPATPAGRRALAQQALDARRGRRKGMYGEFGDKQAAAKAAGEARRAQRGQLDFNSLTDQEKGILPMVTAEGYKMSATSLERQAAELQERYDAMSPEEKYGPQSPDGAFVDSSKSMDPRPNQPKYKPSGESLKRQIDALKKAAERNRVLADAASKGGILGEEDQKKANAERAAEQERQDRLRAGFTSRMARNNPALREQQLQRETEAARKAGAGQRAKGAGLEAASRPPMYTEADQVNTSGRQRMQLHHEFLQDPYGLKVNRAQSTDDQFTDWILRQNQQAGAMKASSQPGKKELEDIQENTEDTVTVLKDIKSELQKPKGAVWQ